MKPKTIITAVLLVFVLASVGYAVSKQLDKAENPGDTTLQTEARFVVFYFHGAKRCETCMKMEAWAREAVDLELSAPLQDGTLEWRLVDISQPENTALAEAYGISFSSVAIAEVKDGETLRHKVLEQTWDLVSDKDAYLNYIATELRTFMEGGG